MQEQVMFVKGYPIFTDVPHPFRSLSKTNPSFHPLAHRNCMTCTINHCVSNALPRNPIVSRSENTGSAWKSCYTAKKCNANINTTNFTE